MHESTLVLNILEIVRDAAGKHVTGAVSRVDLCVGELAGVDKSTMADCFELMALGTVADGAKLSVEVIPATGFCQTCGLEAKKSGRLLVCPECGDSSVKLATGREFYVRSIEVHHPKGSHEHVSSC
jgi:hydrogenase nickel incorporation protein HypA/HybF